MLRKPTAAADDHGDTDVSLRQYVETRFNLLLELIERGDATVKELLQQHDRHIQAALIAQQKLSEADRDAIRTEMEAMAKLFETVHDTSKRAVDKAEHAQLAHNTAANEWRATLSAFQAATIGRPEFDRFYGEFSAFRLESSRVASLSSGVDTGSKEAKQHNMVIVGLVAAIISTLVAVIGSNLFARLGSG